MCRIIKFEDIRPRELDPNRPSVAELEANRKQFIWKLAIGTTIVIGAATSLFIPF